LFNFYEKRVFILNSKQAVCCCVLVLSHCILYRLYTAKTFESCRRYVQCKRTGLDFVEVLKIFNSSKTIFQITKLLFMKN